MSNRIFTPPSEMKPIVPKAGDNIVVQLPWETRYYEILCVHLGGFGCEDAARMIPTDFRQLQHDYSLFVPLCLLQPFLRHKEVIEGYQEDIAKLQKKRAEVRKKALKKLTAEEKEALGLL